MASAARAPGARALPTAAPSKAAPASAAAFWRSGGETGGSGERRSGPLPGREWQPNDSWTPRPGYGGPRPGGPRPGFSGSRPGGPRPGFAGPRPAYSGPRPGAAGPVRSVAASASGSTVRRRRPIARPAPRRPIATSATCRPGHLDPDRPNPQSRLSSPSRPSASPVHRAAPTTAPVRAATPTDRQLRPGPAPTAGWSRPPASPPPADLLGEDEEIVAGRHPVEEAFIAHRKAVRLLVVPQRRQALEKLVLHATNLRIPIVEVEGGTLTSLAGFDGHQGIALVTDRRQFAGLDDLLARAIERKEAPFVIVLDSLEDPQNFGSLLRTAEACGVHGVVYPTHRQAPLSAAAIKASAGAVEHLLLVPVEDLADALSDLHVRGLRIIGSDADAPLTARQADLRGPVAIVVGSEGQGLGPAVRRRCDAVVRIPMRGRVSSLNASVAGSILLYEASSQRGGERPLVAPSPAEPAAEAAASPVAESAAESAAAPGAAEPRPRRRKTARASAAEPPPAHHADELLPGGPAVDPGRDPSGRP